VLLADLDTLGGDRKRLSSGEPSCLPSMLIKRVRSTSMLIDRDVVILSA